MTGNALSGLIMMNSKAPGLQASAKQPTRGTASEDDTFSGIFEEKMRDVSKATRETARSSSRKPLESAKGNSPAIDEENAANDRAADGTVKPKAGQAVTEKTAKVDDEKPDVEETKADGTDETGDDQDKGKTGESDATDMASLIASLLKDIFSKLREITSQNAQQNGQKAENTGAVASTGTTDPLEMLKSFLNDQTGKIKDLIQKLQAQPDSANGESKTLLDTLQDLLPKLEQIKDSAAYNSNGKIVLKLENGEEDPAALIAQLQSHSREITDKLKLKQAQTTGGDGAESGKPAEVAPIEGKETQGSGSMKPKAEKDSAGDEAPKAEAKTIKHETAEMSAKPGKSEAVPKQQLQNAAGLDTQAQPQKPEVTSSAKAEKSDFILSEKPLSQSVTGQVTMKIKLMAGENKQEMEVNLKPDSLGKLNLKIVHERGEILAKITAESDQVKSILESNMQLLKDSLEKSGFTVQSLNVSVGNGNSGSQSRDQGSRKNDSNTEKAAVNLNRTRTQTQTGRIAFGSLTAEQSSIDLSA